MRHLLTAAAISIALSGCGTAVFNHEIEVTLNDPSKRLGSDAVEVSVFDKRSGDSEEWARRTIGTAAPGAPYNGKAWGTDTKMVYDLTPPADVSAGVFLPGLEKGGFFILNIRPVEGPEQATTLAYYSFGVPTAEEDKIPPLPARFTSKGARKGWTIKLTVDVPAIQEP